MQLPPPFTLDGVVLAIPFLGIAQAGFPSPATDYIEQTVSLDKLIIKHPSSTYLCRVSGNRLLEIGIGDGDWAVVDRSLSVSVGRVAAISYRGDLVLARIIEYGHKMHYQSANPLHPMLDIWDEERVQLWGIVTYIVKKFLK